MLDARPRCRRGSLIIGGGAIGCEFASLLGDVGSEVTLLEALPRILPGVDDEAADVVGAVVHEARASSVHTGVRVTGIDGARELTVTLRHVRRRAAASSSTRSS